MANEDAAAHAEADRLAHRINVYWERRGFKANARAVSYSFEGSVRYRVDSDLVNGEPPELFRRHVTQLRVDRHLATVVTRRAPRGDFMTGEPV